MCLNVIERERMFKSNKVKSCVAICVFFFCGGVCVCVAGQGCPRTGV